MCLLLGPDVADRLADAYSDIVGDTSDELAVYDLMWVFNTRHHARWPSPRTENKAMCPTINCHSHTSMSNCGGH